MIDSYGKKKKIKNNRMNDNFVLGKNKICFVVTVGVHRL